MESSHLHLEWGGVIYSGRGLSLLDMMMISKRFGFFLTWIPHSWLSDYRKVAITAH